MCGITGFLSHNKEIDSGKFYEAHTLLRHRGPDDEGFAAIVNGQVENFKGNDTIDSFSSLRHIQAVQKSTMILGHRRLSIIDLSYHGHQPFADPQRHFQLVYNGEIFNYLELRNELARLGHQFEGHSDTEVLLHAFMEWKETAFNRFNGMWSFALYDQREKALTLCRDRFGVKPLYYSFVHGVLYFSSEMKFIQKMMDGQISFNKKAAQDYLDVNFINHNQDTFWNEIKELEPGHFLVFKDGRLTIRSYWNFQPKAADYSEDEALEKFADLFEDSLRLRMRSDVEVGTLLSGGLDSTLIDCTLGKLDLIKPNQFKSFSAVFEDERFSEKIYIDSTIKTVNLKPYFVYPKPGDFKDYLQKLLFHIEDPFRSLAVYSQFQLYEKIHSETNVKVLLNGQGADEIFGGYSYHYYQLFAALIQKLKLKSLLHEIQLLRQNRKVGWKKILLSTAKQVVKSIGHGGYFNYATFHEVKTSALREYLKYDDRTSMAFSVEARVPFLDYRLVEFAFSLSEKFKIHNFINKRIEREYSAGIIPDIVRERKDKTGFVSPQEVWQKAELKPLFDGSFSRIKDDGLLGLMNGRKANEYYQEYIDGKFEDWAFIWRMFCLHEWGKFHKVI